MTLFNQLFQAWLAISVGTLKTSSQPNASVALFANSVSEAITRKTGTVTTCGVHGGSPMQLATFVSRTG